MSKPNVHSLLVAVNLFQLEEFPLKWRVLMAMSTKSNKQGVSWLSAAKICVLLGEVDDQGSPTPDGMKAVRAARQALTKSGILTYFTEVVDAEKQHRWRLNLHAFKPGLADVLAKLGEPEDRWADGEAPKPSKIENVEKAPKPAKASKPKVVEDEEEGDGAQPSEEVEGPSADDIALRKAVLDRARREAEEEARLEAEEEARRKAVPETKKKIVTWDDLFTNNF